MYFGIVSFKDGKKFKLVLYKDSREEAKKEAYKVVSSYFTKAEIAKRGGATLKLRRLNKEGEKLL